MYTKEITLEKPFVLSQISHSVEENKENRDSEKEMSWGLESTIYVSTRYFSYFPFLLKGFCVHVCSSVSCVAPCN